MHVIPPRKGDSDLEFAALLYLLVFAASGVCVSGLVFRGDRPVLRLWLGLVAGLVMLMWFPALFAFISGSFDIWRSWRRWCWRSSWARSACAWAGGPA